MPVPEFNQPITKPGGLTRLANILADQPILAVDTESNSLFAYHEQVGLIQFSPPEADYLLDPLGFGDLALLAPIFADENIQKTFHAAEYDLLCMKRDYGFEFNNLFATMLAAHILGRKQLHLGALREE